MAPWDITAASSHDGRVLVDLSTHPNDKYVAFFITSFTMIESDHHHDQHHDHGDDDDKPMEYLHMENASRTSAEVSDLPVFTNFTLTAYLVDMNKEIYRSEEITTETPEGGEYNMLWHYFILGRYICQGYCLLSNIALFFRVYIASSKHEEGWEI